MHNHLTKICSIVTLCVCLTLFGCTADKAPTDRGPKPEANQGIMDLRGWDWEQKGTVQLNGEWEFYWQEFLFPRDFQQNAPSDRKNFIVLPRAWNKYTVNSQELSGSGYATYRLVIYLNHEETMGIKIPRIFTSYRLWANGKEVASAGQIGTNQHTTVPQYLPQVHYLSADRGTIELIIQVANFRHRSGGILESIQLGAAPQISRLQSGNLALELFLFGSLFIIGFYHLVLFLYRTKDRANLYFGLYTVLISMRTLLVGEIHFIHLFPGFSWEIAHKIQTLAYYLGVLLVFLFLKATFPQEASKKWTAFIRAIACSFALLVLLTPARIFTLFNPVYQIFSLVVIAYLLYLVALACYRKREGAFLIGVGIIFLILFSLNDIVFLSIVVADTDNHFLRSIVTRGNLASVGLLISVFTQALVLAKRFSQSFSRVEHLSEQLTQMNLHLEEKVRERTAALEASREELRKAYQAVSRSEKSLQDLMQNISHDLRTPLSAIKGYADALLDGVVTEPRQQRKYLARVIDKVNNLNSMVQELLDLSRLQSRQLKLDFTTVPLKSFIDNMFEKNKLDMLNKPVDLKVQFPSSWKGNKRMDDLMVRVNMERMERVLSNLLNNALKYTAPGGCITLNCSITPNGKTLITEISDTGIGISREDLPHIFERFYKVSKTREGTGGGRGLGLAIVKEIIDYHGGQVWVESELEQGSRFFFTLPVYHDQDQALFDTN